MPSSLTLSGVMSSNLFRGTLNLVILEALRHGPMHGYAIGRWIREHTDGVLDVDEGLLYPTLHRLRTRGWLDATWGTSTSGRRAKYYSLTPTGTAHLESEGERWRQYSAAVLAVLNRGSAGG